MNEVISAEQIKKLTAPILEKGFAFEYLYQKGGDSSCVYICRYKKGKDYLDWREVSGGEEINIVVYVGGAFQFPSLKYLYKKEHRAFAWKHLFKKATMAEKRAFVAGLLNKQLESGDLFGIRL
ncbi:MAG: hypothetical protein E7380_05045 [Clostridiales bacterium]|nr:hypothetical protein [Clostridiales bacterium]